jgi:hypothetical protein
MSRRKPMRYGFVPALSLLVAAGLVLGAASAFGDTCQSRSERAYETAIRFYSGAPLVEVFAQAVSLREQVQVSRMAARPRLTSAAFVMRAAEREKQREMWLCQRVALQRASAP